MQDITNHVASNGTSSIDLKRRWHEDGNETPAMKRSLPTSSSSPGGRTSSSSPTNNQTRYLAYDAPTSPDALSSHKFASSLPPSSPTFGATLDTEAENPPSSLVLAAALASASTSEVSVPQTHTASPIEIEELSIDSDGTNRRLNLERGIVMQFGRKAKRPTQPRPETTLPIQLPKSAKHASRMHCLLRILPRNNRTRSDEIVLEARVMGMNGMKIDGKIYRKGSVAVLSVRAGHELDVNFWSWRGVVHVAESEKIRDEEEETATAKTLLTRLSSPVASSVFDSLFDEASDRGHRDGSFELDLADPTKANDLILASPTLSDQSALSALPSSPSRMMSSRASELVDSLNLDLAGLIAGSIVFSPRSTVGVEDVVRALLKDVGGMWTVLEDGKGMEDQSEEREDRAVEAWWEVVERVLYEEPFFGCIDNAGLKDASGHPLLPAFFYMPDSDPSQSRVMALEPFVKRVRGARQRPAQYFWRKPSLKKNR